MSFLFAQGVWEQPVLHTEIWSHHVWNDTKKQKQLYISLLIISCIIEYVTNKITLNLELRQTKMLQETYLTLPNVDLI